MLSIAGTVGGVARCGPAVSDIDTGGIIMSRRHDRFPHGYGKPEYPSISPAEMWRDGHLVHRRRHMLNTLAGAFERFKAWFWGCALPGW